MTYIINKTDGTVLTQIIDGNIDQTSTDLTLIGKSANAYGEYINENLVHLLENFANSSQPSKSIPGQLWFDTIENRLKVYDGKGYKVTGGTIVSKTLPSSIAQGDIWINPTTKQLWFNDGVETVLAGPQLPGVTGYSVVTVYGTDQNSYTVIKLMINQTLVAILSNDEFLVDINSSSDIVGWPVLDPILVGLNFVNESLITNVKTSTEPSHAVNNERLETAIKQISPFAISLDISGLHDAQDDAYRHDQISLMLEKIFPALEYQVGDLSVLPTCKVLCSDGDIKTVRTFMLSAGTLAADNEIKWRQVNDIIPVSSILT